MIFTQPVRYRANHHIFFIYLVTKDNGLNPKGLNKSMVKPKIQSKYQPAKCVWLLRQNPIYLCTKSYLHLRI